MRRFDTIVAIALSTMLSVSICSAHQTSTHDPSERERGRISRLRGICFMAILAAVLAAFCPPTLSAQPYLYANNADGCIGNPRSELPQGIKALPHGYIYQIDLATGTAGMVVKTYTLAGCDGRGVAVVHSGGGWLYYTYSSNRNVYKCSLTGPDCLNGNEHFAFTVPGDPLQALASLAYDGKYLWIQDYPRGGGPTKNVYKCTLTGSCYPPIIMSNCLGNGCDGLEYFQIPGIFSGTPHLIANHGDHTGPYDVLTTSGGPVTGGAGYISPGGNPTGIAWDGSFFYTGDVDNNGIIYKWDRFGLPAQPPSITLSGYDPSQPPYIEDLAADFASATSCFLPPNTTMVAWYAFDEATGGMSGNLATGNTGTWYPTNGLPIPVTGAVGKALSFNGIDQYVESPSTIVTDFGPGKACQGVGQGDYSSCTGDFSIDTWIQVPQDASRDVMTILDKRVVFCPGCVGPLTATLGYHFFLQNGQMGLQLADGDPTNYFSPTLPSIYDGEWHHIAVTIRRNSPPRAINWYYDGLCVDTPTCTTSNPTGRLGSLVSNGPLRIGTRTAADPFTGWFKGSLDELEIYNRVLTPDEVLGIYKAQVLGKCKPPSPTSPL